MSMSWSEMMPMFMKMMQQQGGGQGQPSGQPMTPNFGGGMNYFNPQGGSSYGSQAGMLGGGAPSGGGGGGGAGGGGAMLTPGQRAGGIGSGIFDLFFAKDPSDDASKYLDQMGGSVDKYMDPYINAGKDTMPLLQGQYKQLMNDPTSIMSMVGNKYQQSPGYQFQTQQAEGAANRAGAAGGMLGSPQQQQQIAQSINGIANQDYNGFLDRGLGLYGQGMSGMNDINHMGMDASSQAMMAKIQAYLAQATNAYAGAANSNQTKSGGIGSILGGMFG